jgi:hypothetical protein
MLLED